MTFSHFCINGPPKATLLGNSHWVQWSRYQHGCSLAGVEPMRSKPHRNLILGKLASKERCRPPAVRLLSCSQRSELTGRSSTEWSPQNFKYPEVSAIDFSLLEKEPPPYRPFRWGPVYHVVRHWQWDDALLLLIILVDCADNGPFSILHCRTVID